MESAANPKFSQYPRGDSYRESGNGSQIVKDGDEIYIEYGNGPQAFTVRWEGRPDTPPFQWGDEGVVLPGPDLWLQQVDLCHENIDQLIPSGAKDEDAQPKQDLDAVKALLLQHCGSLQACFLVYECLVC